MTQEQLGRLLGVSTEHVNRLEKGKKAITTATHVYITVLARLPQALKIAKAEVGL